MFTTYEDARHAADSQAEKEGEAWAVVKYNDTSRFVIEKWAGLIDRIASQDADVLYVTGPDDE
jgi:hypothetical protein